MKILYTCDNNYVWLMGISAMSLFEKNREEKELEVYLLGMGISGENQEKLRSIAQKYGRSITVLHVPETFSIPQALCSARWPLSGFVRLYAGELLPGEMDRVLYIDCDTLIVDSLREIWETPLDGELLSGVRDCVSWRYIRNIGGDPAGPYFNAGVLLMDLEAMRRESMGVTLDRYISQYQPMIHYADQDVLNGAFAGRIGTLPARANVMTIQCHYSAAEIETMRRPNAYYPRGEAEEAAQHPAIIHFSTCMTLIRPWFQGSTHPYAEQFLAYKAQSPWADRPLAVWTPGSKKERLLSAIDRLPRKLATRVIGVLHTWLVPTVQQIKGRRGVSHGGEAAGQHHRAGV